VLALCARTTDYAELFRRTDWGRTRKEAVIVSPELYGLGGAQRAVPLAIGEALSAALSGRLTSIWRSGSGKEVRSEVLA
jgi:hypothetical protein